MKFASPITALDLYTRIYNLYYRKYEYLRIVFFSAHYIRYRTYGYEYTDSK